MQEFFFSSGVADVVYVQICYCQLYDDTRYYNAIDCLTLTLRISTRRYWIGISDYRRQTSMLGGETSVSVSSLAVSTDWEILRHAWGGLD